MAMGINTNLASINAQRMLSQSQNGLATSMQRLSSGLRVNSAKDDAAGLAIAERMHSQIRGMNQAARNANDAISLLQTAEGATSKITDMLQRMREIAVQSANATNSENDRKALQAEVSQLKQEIDRVGASSKFNGLQVFDQSRLPVAGGDPDAHILMEKLKSGWLANAEALVKERFGIEAPPGTGMQVNVTSYIDGVSNTYAWVKSEIQPGGNGPGKNITLELELVDFVGLDEVEAQSIIAHEMVHAVMASGPSWTQIRANPNVENRWFTEGVAEFVVGANGRVLTDNWNEVKNRTFESWTQDGTSYSFGYVAVRALHDELKTAGVTEGIKDLLEELQTTAHATLDSAIAAVIDAGTNSSSAFTLSQFKQDAFAASGIFYSSTSAPPSWLVTDSADDGGIGGTNAEGSGGTARTGQASITPTTPPSDSDMEKFAANWEQLPSASTPVGVMMGFQVGANAGDFVYTNIGAMNLGSLGIENLDVSTVSGSTSAMVLLDNAIDYVSSQRGNMGALMSRFENIIANLNISSENASASRGRIMDADFAVETASLSRAQILQQAGTAMVAQANQLPQTVLSLLR